MAKQDIETIFFDLLDFAKANLNTQITAVNTDKGDTVLDQINAGAWLVGSLDDSCKSYNNFVFAYIAETSATTVGNQVNRKGVFEFDIVIAEKEDGNDYKRVLRYHRALEQTMIQAWDKICKGYDRAQINLLNPIDVQLYDSSYWSKVVGIQVEFNLAN
jgi:hypothetical protein